MLKIRSLLGVALCVLIFLNVAIFISNLLWIKKREAADQSKLLDEAQYLPRENLLYPERYSDTASQPDFYNLPCPQVNMVTIRGQKINPTELAGNVILIRFSKFYRQEISYLAYLQHLADKYKNEGVLLILINCLGIHDEDAINRIFNFTAPIVIDDGHITAQFGAYSEDLIIIDRKSSIKFKYHRAPKYIVNHEIMKYVFDDDKAKTPPADPRGLLGKLLYKTRFFDVIKKNIVSISELRQDNMVLALYTSICTGCEEDSRIALLQEFSAKIKRKKIKPLILFGKGNNPDAIERYVILNGWQKSNLIFGVITDITTASEIDYYRIFDFNVDPRIIVFSKEGEISFVEDSQSIKFVNLDFLKNLIK